MEPTDQNADEELFFKEDCDASEAMVEPLEKNSDEEVACEVILARKEEDFTDSSSAQFFDVKKEDDGTCTTQAESLGDQSVCTSTQEYKDHFSIRIKGTLFVGIESSTNSSRPCGLDSGNESSTGAE